MSLELYTQIGRQNKIFKLKLEEVINEEADTYRNCEVGCAYNQGMKRNLELRETEKYYISEYGTKYRKDDGSRVGERFPIFKLDISTVKAL